MDEATLFAIQKLAAKVNEIQEAVYVAYCELWARNRALIHVVSQIGGVRTEQLETDAQAWFEAHHERLIDEGHDRLAMLLGKKPPPPI